MPTIRAACHRASTVGIWFAWEGVPMEPTTWREVLRENAVEVQEPVPPGDLAAGERRLGIELPADLRQMYEATDGLYDGGGEWFVMWRFADLVERNLEAWKLESGDRRLQLGFGDDGTGNPFCIRLDGD